MKKYAFNLRRPFSYSVFVYIFLLSSTSDGVQYSGLKTLHCTPSDVLAFVKMQTIHSMKKVYTVIFYGIILFRSKQKVAMQITWIEM